MDEPTHEQHPRLLAGEKGSAAGNYRIFGRWRKVKLIIIAAVVLIALLAVISGLLQKWLWMRELGYTGVFWTLLSVRCGLFCGAFVVALLYLWINLRLATRNGATFRAGKLTSESTVATRLTLQISPMMLRVVMAAIAAAAALIISFIFYGQWDTYLRFRYGGSFGLSDPLFGVDAGFYLFRLPFYELLQSSLTALALITLLAVLAFYAYFGIVRSSRSAPAEGRKAKAVPHLSALFFVLVASWGWGFYLDHYELLYSTQGVVYGAGYTADHVTRIAFWIMAAAAVSLCALLVLNILRPRFRAVAIGSGIYVALYVIAVWLAPALFQRFIVQPNELARETPYLKNNIEFTRKAYSLDTIQETSYPALSDLTSEVIARNQDTIQNIRLWDWRPLLQMYQQAQEIRLYYQFYQADVDRYHLPDGYHQVMLSTRELSAELPAEAQTWVNQKLQFTHGYGLAMSFVSKTVGGGFPQYVLENIPPESAYGLNDKPAFHLLRRVDAGISDRRDGRERVRLPQGESECLHELSAEREASRWIACGSGSCSPGLRPMSIFCLPPIFSQRAGFRSGGACRSACEQIAPFLRLDQDPYAVVSEGKLYWIQDAYTVSDHFPYSTPHAAAFDRRAELHSKLREGRCGHVRRNRPLLRHGSERPRPGSLPARVSGRFPGPESAFGGSENASAVSGGSLLHPGRPVQNIPHDGSAGLL